MKSSRFLAVCAITAALIFVLSAIPQGWGMPFLGLVPVLVVIVAFRDLKVSIFASLCAGVVSWLFSYIRPTLVSEYFQTNVFLPIIPRFLAGLLAHYTCVFVYKMSKKNIWYTSISGAIVGSILNTVFVLASLYLFVPVVSENNATFWAYFILIIPTAAIELLLNSVLTLWLGRAVYISVGKEQSQDKREMYENLDV